MLFPSRIDPAVLENQDPDDSLFSISFDLVLRASSEMADGSAAEYLASHTNQWLILPTPEGR